MVQNLAFLTGEEKMIQLLQSKNNIEYIYNTVVTGYEGETNLQAIRLLNTETQETLRLEIDGIFLAIGTAPENDAYQPIDGTGAQVLGKVTAVVRQYS